MGRNAIFDESQFIAAARMIVAGEGPAGLSMQKIAMTAGATTGSVYHRFASLDTILALTWLDAAERFQNGFAARLHGETKFYDAVLAGSLFTPQFSREFPDEAGVLLRCDARELVAKDLAPELQVRLKKLQRQLRRLMLDTLARFPGRRTARNQNTERMALLQFLLVDMPLAAVRPHLLNRQRPPVYIDTFVQTSVVGFRKALQGG